MRLFRLIIILLLMSVFVACSSKKKELSEKEKIELIKEIKSRKEFKTKVALNLVDTTLSSFGFLKKYNTHLSEKIEKKTYEFYSKNGFKTRWLYRDKPTKFLIAILRI